MASPEHTGKTSIVLNPPEQPDQQRTYVVFGTNRGGTSMVAGVLRALGLDLGDVGERKNNEDANFQNRAVDAMREAIGRRDATHDVWGWKFPAAANYLPVLSSSVRNPYYVVVYRDPVAAALSQSRLGRPATRRTPRVAVHEASSNANTNTGFALATNRPCLLVSNERATQNQEALIEDLADFLHVERPDADLRSRILDYIAPGQYKSFHDFFDPTSSPPGTLPPPPGQPTPPAGGPLREWKRRLRR